MKYKAFKILNTLCHFFIREIKHFYQAIKKSLKGWIKSKTFSDKQCIES